MNDIDYTSDVAVTVDNNKLLFNNSGKDFSEEISVSAIVGGIEISLNTIALPYHDKCTNRIKFGYIIESLSSSFASNVQYIKFKIVSNQTLVKTGNSVGYWLENNNDESTPSLFEFYAYNFKDILKNFTYEVEKQVYNRKTGKYETKTVNESVPYEIEISDKTAYITFDVRKMEFVEGQELDFDPVAITGSVTDYDDSGASGSTSVTVPTDATLALVTSAFWHWEGGTGWTTLTLGGDSYTIAVSSTNSDYELSYLGYLVNPSTGSQTFAFDYDDESPTTGTTFSFMFLKGVDTGDPIRGSGSGVGNADIASSSFTSAVGDLCVCVGSASTSVDAGYGANQTEQIDNAGYNSCYSAVGTKPGVAGSTTMTIEETGGIGTGSISAVSVKASAAAGPAGVKTINDTAIASVKTINNTAIASVKTINDAS